MRNYWSCSKFANWLRGIKKPKHATINEWHEWEQYSKKIYPFRYWLTEVFLNRIQQVLYWIPECINDIRYYINNRWISRSHSLTAHSRDIKPGQWCDVGNRFLPCLFNELVDFVEVECAWHYVMWDKTARKKYKTPWSRHFFHFRTWRCAEAGIDYFKWAMTLTDAEWIKEGETPQATEHALAAKEILELYNWWKEVYPNRPDLYDISGWNEYCETYRKDGYSIFDNKTPEEKETIKSIFNKIKENEILYDKEDEEMMVRLIKIRQHLWT
jgi:hypothetical protein